MIPIEQPSIANPAALVGPVVITLLCWAYLLGGAGTGMSVQAMTTLQLPPPMDLPPVAIPWDLPRTVIMAAMWWAMMLAMMLPGAIIQAHGHAVWSAPRGALFFAGYALTWLLFSLIATMVQGLLEHAGWMHGMTMWSINAELSGILLVLAGAWQFLPAKQAALIRCGRQAHKPYPLSAGFSHGRDCLTATVPLMMLLFVGGAMNLYWIIGLSMIVTAEKVLPAPSLVSWLTGGFCFVLAARIALT